MRSSIAFLLLLRVLPSVGQVDTPECQGVSPRDECKGIQGTGKNADICCAEDCTCACGGNVDANEGKDCFLTEIREERPGMCTGGELNAACALGPEPITGAPCGIVDGVLDEDSMLCCPAGCGTCGGTECSTMPMSWVQPDPLGGPLAVDPSVPETATSADYCCMSAMENLTAVCGVDGAVAPCRMPQELPDKQDSCMVEGIQGTVHAGGEMCCPLGCDICGSFGCGNQHLSEVMPGTLPWSTSAPDGAKTSDYCCTDAFKADVASQDRFCGDEGVEPPCLIPTATLPPRDGVVDTCGVEGMEGIADGNKCCPVGCGQCGGPGCGTIDMGYVLPTLQGTATPPFNAKSSLYCCSGTTTFTDATPVCGGENFPPCYITDPAAPVTPAPVQTPEPGATSPPITPVDGLPDTCNLPGMPGVLDGNGSRCCPQGCGMCGGPGCGSIDMSVVGPTVYGGVPEGAGSGDYCCHSGVDERAVTCGTGDPVVHPPCFMPAAPTEDSCNVQGIEGVASSNRKYCCPLGCGQCGGSGCGAVPETQIFSDGRELALGATASFYCCTGGGGFAVDTVMSCDEAGAEPPCLIPEGTPTPAPVTPAPMPMDAIGGGGSGSGSNGSDAPDGPDTVVDPPTPTPAPLAEVMMSCENIHVMVEDAEEFDGDYIMDMENEFLFVKNDTSAVMMYAPHEADDMDTTVNATATMNDTTNSTECGYWTLAMLEDGNFTMSQFPVVAVQSCAMNPEDVDVGATWMTQRMENETAVSGAGLVECLDVPMTPTPVTPTPMTPTPMTPTPMTPTSPTDGGDKTNAPVPTPAPVGDSPTTPPAGDRAAPTTVTSDGSSGLSTGEAVGVGVGVSAVAVVGAVAISRWAKNR